MLKLISNWLEARRVRRRIEQILKTASADLPRQLDRMNISFVLLQVRDDKLDQAHAHLGTALETVSDCDGWTDIMCSCVIAVFGPPLRPSSDDDRIHCEQCVSLLTERLGDNVRLIYGNTDCLVGNTGIRRRFHYGVLMTDFHRHLATLIALEFGRAARIS